MTPEGYIEDDDGFADDERDSDMDPNLDQRGDGPEEEEED